MKFDKFSGTDEAGKRDDFADKAKSSSSSEANSRDAKGLKDRDSLTLAIKQLEVELQGNSVKIGEIQLRLGELNSEVKGRQLMPSRYQQLCAEQTRLRKEEFALRQECTDTKKRLHSLRTDLALITTQLSGDGGYSTSLKKETNRLLEEILSQLKMMTRLLTENKT